MSARCADCRHAPHVGPCFNMASDNDCNCKSSGNTEAMSGGASDGLDPVSARLARALPECVVTHPPGEGIVIRPYLNRWAALADRLEQAERVEAERDQALANLAMVKNWRDQERIKAERDALAVQRVRALTQKWPAHGIWTLAERAVVSALDGEVDRGR